MDPEELAQSIGDLQAALSRLSLAVSRSSAHDESPWELVGPPASSSSSRVPRGHFAGAEPGVTSAAPRAAPTRSSIAASFPPWPDHCIDLCGRLSSSASFSPADRARRAWVAGQWAKAVLQGEVPTPLPTPVLNVKPTCYVVLRSDRLPGPARYSTYSAFRAAVGPLEGSDSVTHSFGSISEARVFCIAAGVDFPRLSQ